MANVRPIRAAFTTGAEDEKLIRQSIDEFMRAFQAKDVDAIMKCYAPDVEVYDMMVANQLKGSGPWRELWEKSLGYMDGQISTELRDLKIDLSGDLAAAHALSHFKMTGGKKDEDIWMRWSGVFKKINGEWKVIHEHTSVPVEMESMKAMSVKP